MNDPFHSNDATAGEEDLFKDEDDANLRFTEEMNGETSSAQDGDESMPVVFTPRKKVHTFVQSKSPATDPVTDVKPPSACSTIDERVTLTCKISTRLHGRLKGHAYLSSKTTTQLIEEMIERHCPVYEAVMDK